MDIRLATLLEQKGFKRPIDIKEDYYAKGDPDGAEEYWVRVLTKKESNDWLDSDEVEGKADALWLIIGPTPPLPKAGAWDIGLNDMSSWEDGPDEASLIQYLETLPDVP